MLSQSAQKVCVALALSAAVYELGWSTIQDDKYRTELDFFGDLSIIAIPGMI